MAESREQKEDKTQALESAGRQHKSRIERKVT